MSQFDLSGVALAELAARAEEAAERNRSAQHLTDSYRPRLDHDRGELADPTRWSSE